MYYHYTPSQKRILIVDDDRDIGAALQTLLTEETPYRTLWIAESDLALLSANHLRPSLILLDYQMPLMNGLCLYDSLQESKTMRGVPVVLISAVSSLPFKELQQRGIRILKKPFEICDLFTVVDEMIAR